MESLLKNRPNYFMNEALKEAKLAFEEDEVPVGAIIATDDHIIARAHNQVEKLNDVTAHAEMIAITSAANYLGTKYLEDCSIFITIEPCPMCAAALFWSKIKVIYYGAPDEKYGFANGKHKMFSNKVAIKSGLLEHECGSLMTDFFRSKRDLDNLNL